MAVIFLDIKKLGNAQKVVAEGHFFCVRKIKNTGLFKPYAIIDEQTFVAEAKSLKKEKPLN